MTGLWRSVAGYGLAVIVALAAGCSGSREPQAPKFEGDDNIRAVYTAYKDAAAKLGRPPKKVEDIEPFLKQHGDPDQLLISPNDSMPYVINWNADPRATTAIVVYEQKGKDGKRIVIGGQGIMQVPEPVFNAMIGGKK